MGAADVGFFFMVIVLLIIINTSVIDTIYELSITRDTKDGIKMIIRVVSLIVFLISFNLLNPEEEDSHLAPDYWQYRERPKKWSRSSRTW